VVKLNSWSLDDFVSTLQHSHATLTSLVPAQIFDLVSRDIKCPSSLRAVLVGGGALSPSLYEKGVALGWPLLRTYGMSETCSQVATESLNAIGNKMDLRVLPHLRVETTEDDRLRISGESLLTAYLFWAENQPLRVNPKEQGWFTSQDRGKVQERSLSILGRSGDFVKIGGESVELGRLHQVLDEVKIDLSLNGDAAVLAVPDERLGHVIHLISDSEVSEKRASAIIEKFNSKVLAFEKIRKWHRLDQVPRTSLGKLITAECLSKISFALPTESNSPEMICDPKP
jgi:O-succinylbenzoic acid--CoA ligase